MLVVVVTCWFRSARVTYSRRFGVAQASTAWTHLGSLGTHCPCLTHPQQSHEPQTSLLREQSVQNARLLSPKVRLELTVLDNVTVIIIYY